MQGLLVKGLALNGKEEPPRRIFKMVDFIDTPVRWSHTLFAHDTNDLRRVLQGLVDGSEQYGFAVDEVN